MPVKRIDSIYDVAALEAEQAKVNELLEQSKQAIINLNNTRVAAKGTDLTGMTTATQQLSDAINATTSVVNKTTTAFNNLTAAQKAKADLDKQIANATTKQIGLTSDQAVELQKLNLQNSEQAKKNKEVAQSALGMLNAYQQLKKEYDAVSLSAKNLATIAAQTGDQKDIDAAKAATEQAMAMHQQLLSIEQSVGQSQRNVGNYTGAISILTDALAEAKAKLDQMSESDKENTAAGKETQQQVELLTQLVGQQSKGFTTLSREITQTTQALAEMKAKGLEDTQGYKDLQNQLANSRRSLADFNQEQKILSSNAPALTALTNVARGLGAIYATGAGAAALFADGNEKVEKELNKLVAVMTLLQGLAELHKFMTESNATATALLSLKTTALNVVLGIKNFIMTGSTKAIAENTAGTEVMNAATAETTIVTTAATVAMRVFRAALIATGVGALVVGLGLLINYLSNLSTTSDDAASAVDRLTAALKRQDDQLKDNLSGVDIETQNIVNQLKIRGATDKEINDAQIAGLKEKTRITAEESSKQFAALQDLEDKKQKLEEDKRRLEAVGAGTKDVDKAIQDQDKLISAQSDAWKAALKGATDAQVALEQATQQFQVDQAQKQRDADKKKADDDKKKREQELKDLQDSLKRAQDYRDQANAEIEKAENDHLQVIRDNYKAEAEDQTKSLAERYAAIEAYNNAGLKLLDSQKKADEDALAVEVRNDLAGAKTKQEVEAIKQLAAAKTSSIEKKYADDAATFQKGVQDEYTKAAQDDWQKIEDAAKQAYQHIKEVTDQAFSNQKNAIDIDADNQILALQKKVQDGQLKNEDNYNNQVTAIKDAAGQKQDELELKRLQAQMLIEGQFGKLDTDLQKKIADQEIKINDDKNKKLLAAEKDLLEQKQKFQAEALKDVQSFVDDSFDAQKNRIQDEIDLNDQQAQRQIDLVEASTASEQDKAAEVTQIQAKQAAQKTALLKQQRDEDVKKAEFDKAMAVVSVGIETAKTLALITAKAAVAFPFGAPILAEIPWVIGTSALEIAAILAKPIPKYKGGRNGGDAEFAFVGDGNVSEIIARNGGSVEKTPNRATLTYLGAGDKVYKDEKTFINEVLKSNPTLLDNNNIMDVMKDLTLGALAAVNFDHVDHSNDRLELSNMTNRIEKAVGNIKINTQVVTKEGWRTHNKRLSDYDAWVQRYIKN